MSRCATAAAGTRYIFVTYSDLCDAMWVVFISLKWLKHPSLKPSPYSKFDLEAGRVTFFSRFKRLGTGRDCRGSGQNKCPAIISAAPVYSLIDSEFPTFYPLKIPGPSNIFSKHEQYVCTPASGAQSKIHHFTTKHYSLSKTLNSNPRLSRTKTIFQHTSGP
jgi:hypothetical protein